MDNLKKNSMWTLLIIDDPSFLSGKSIYDIIQIILKIISFNFVILNDIEGSGKDWLISSLQGKKDSIIATESFLRLLNDIKQLDWGDFFLFKKYPHNWDNFKEEAYPYVIAQTDTTIRVVDNQYIYIYTSYQKIVDIIKSKYEIESIKKDFLDNLDYPY